MRQTKILKKAKLCYMDTGSLIVYKKIEEYYEDNGNDAETRFDISNYVLERLLTNDENKKLSGLMAD